MIFGEKIIQIQQSALGLIIGHVALIKTQKEDYALTIFLFLSSVPASIRGFATCDCVVLVDLGEERLNLILVPLVQRS